MAKLPRIYNRLFGSNGSLDQFGKFGSLAAGTPETTLSPTLMQSLSNWLDGWYGAIVGENSPSIQDMNAFCYVMSYQLGYLLQAGIPEWDTTTIYFTGDLARVGTTVYQSLIDTNTGQAVTDGTKWMVWKTTGKRTLTTTGAILNTDDVVRLNTTAGSFTATLPTIATSVGQKVVVKWIDNGILSKPTISANGAELIELAVTLLMQSPGDSVTLYNNGTNWEII